MLNKLIEAESMLRVLLYQDDWESLDVTYHPPHVERVWRQWGDYRIALHRIHPVISAGDALFHKHPWPSAIYIASGSYEMGIAESVHLRWGSDRVKLHEPTLASLDCRLVLPAGTRYEMANKDGYHYVRPTEGPVMSVMVSGPPWSPGKPGLPISREPLSQQTKEGILDFFRLHYQ